MTVQDEINEMLISLSDLPKSDLLVNVSDSAATVEVSGSDNQIEVTPALRKILREAVTKQREADVNSLCLATQFIRWNDKPDLLSPIWLHPVYWKWKSTDQTFRFSANECATLNPYIRFRLTELNGSEAAEIHTETLEEFGEILEKSLLGNFHMDRFAIYRELSGIKDSPIPDLIQILHGEKSVTPRSREHLEYWFSPVDASQRNAILKAEKEPVVIQGPPGTGKSQVLMNLIGRHLLRDHRVLAVSEKKQALQVLEKKMAAAGLDPFVFAVHSQTATSDLLAKLSKTWQLAESWNRVHVPFPVYEAKLAQLSRKMEHLRSIEVLGGHSLSEYKKWLHRLPETVPVPDAPDINEWSKHQDYVEKILSNGGIGADFTQRFFQVENPAELLSQLERLCVQLDVTDCAELTEQTENLHVAVLIGNGYWQLMHNLYKKPREANKLRKAVSDRELLVETLQLMQLDLAIWKRIPGIIELDAFDSARGTLNKFIANRRLRKLLAGAGDLKQLVEITRNYHETNRQLLEIETIIRSFNLQPGTEARLALDYLIKLQSTDESRLRLLGAWPMEKIQRLVRNRQELEQCSSLLKLTARDGFSGSLMELIVKGRKMLSELGPLVKLAGELPGSIFRIVRQCSSFQEAEAVVVTSNYHRFRLLFPDLAGYSGTKLQEELIELINHRDEEIQHATQLVQNKICEAFHRADELLRTNPAKLSADDKSRRLRLKRGKALLVKEFSKTRSHPTIRELLESDAREWIQILLPVWMATPMQLADHFPLQEGLFDMALIDEASQMPLPAAYGTLFRSWNVAICGDDQQMSPSSYFGKPHRWHDLFHQANYNLPASALNHHYRSEQPELIEFSNRHFYRNSLITFPPANTKQSIFLHRVPGIYSSRINLVEAEAVAAWLKLFDWTSTLGIVAFSEEQLKCILTGCSSEVLERIETGEESGNVFVKTLEQVQGDEADIVVVSMGYAKDEHGNFRMQFGPLNQLNGYKRLNVLLTRARQEFHFFSSVRANDFRMSKSEGVNLLRRFLAYTEESEQKAETQFPFEIQPEINGDQLTISDILNKDLDAQELITLHDILSRAGWKILYKL